MSDVETAYDDWLVQMHAQRDAEFERGTVEVGGPFESIDYVAAYVRSARAVLQTAANILDLESLCVTCVHLQRHALELILKITIERCRELEAIKTEASTGVRPGMATRAPITHNLTTLYDVLVKDLGAHQMALPPDMKMLVDEMSATEDGDETRVRYPRGSDSKRRGGGASYAQDSFPARIRFPLGDWQRRLESLEGSVSRVSWRFGFEPVEPPLSVGERLSQEAARLVHALREYDVKATLRCRGIETLRIPPTACSRSS